MTSLKCFGVVLLATLVAGEIPSYFKVCQRSDPNLDACVLSATEALRDKLREGIPDLDAPPIEPLYLDELPLSNTDRLKAFARNVKLSGLSNFEANSVHVDFEKQRLDVDVVFKHIGLDADYDVNAKIVVPIHGRGPIHVITDDVRANVVLKYKLIKKNGVEYMFFTSMTTKLSIKDYTAEFKPVEGSDSSALATAINTAIQGGRQEILASITPALEKIISVEVLKVSNKICTHFTFDELFPNGA